jgi:hypothetical protein
MLPPVAERVKSNQVGKGRPIPNIGIEDITWPDASTTGSVNVIFKYAALDPVAI